MMEGMMYGKKVSLLVEEQLRYCRSLRRADMLSVVQEVATDEDCLKKANSLIMMLKADVRALNTCAARLLPPPDGEIVADATIGNSEVAQSAYQVETIERLFRRFRQVDPRNTSAGCIKAVSATNELVVMRERLQAGLTARLLELKTEMDKEFGTAFVDIESYLRTEKGLRAAKEGLNQTVLLKALREERNVLAKKLDDAEVELKRIHHSYTEMMTPEVAVGLENRQRQKIEEQEADLGRLKNELKALKRDHERLLAENGRLSDNVAELHSQLLLNKEQYARELACLTPKVTTAENRAAEIEGLVDQMNLRLSLLNSSNKKASEEMQRLKAQLSVALAEGHGAQLSTLQQEVIHAQGTIKKLEALNARKDRLITAAMSARNEACTEYRALKKGTEEHEKRFRDAQARWVLLEVQKENYTTKLKESEDRLKSAEGREIRMSEQLRRITEAIKLKTQENEILLRRLDDQEMELRNYSNLQKESEALSSSKNELMYRVTTVTDMLEMLKTKAISLGMGRELGLC